MVKRTGIFKTEKAARAIGKSQLLVCGEAIITHRLTPSGSVLSTFHPRINKINRANMVLLFRKANALLLIIAIFGAKPLIHYSKIPRKLSGFRYLCMRSLFNGADRN